MVATTKKGAFKTIWRFYGCFQSAAQRKLMKWLTHMVFHDANDKTKTGKKNFSDII